jgi:hypothetical protein
MMYNMLSIFTRKQRNSLRNVVIRFSHFLHLAEHLSGQPLRGNLKFFFFERANISLEFAGTNFQNMSLFLRYMRFSGTTKSSFSDFEIKMSITFERKRI